MTTRAAYPSDLTDAEWCLLEPLLTLPPREDRRGRPREVVLREVTNAVVYVLQEGCRWRALPHDFPAWPAVYWYFARWTDRGKAGTKRHLLVDRRGVPLAVVITPANVYDSRVREEVLDAIPPIRGLQGRPRRRPAIAVYGVVAVQPRIPCGGVRCPESNAALRGRQRVASYPLPEPD